MRSRDHGTVFDAPGALLAGLADGVGTPRFAEALLAASRQVADIDELFAYVARPGMGPHELVRASRLAGQEDRISRYRSRYFRFDPVLFGDAADGPGHREIASPDVRPSDYRRLCFDTPCFRGKISVRWRHRDALLVMSFYSRSAWPWQQRAVADVAWLGNLALSHCLSHPAVSSPAELTQRLERRIAADFPGLAAQEVAVLARYTLGNSVDEIACDLGLRPCTVKTYRQRARGKLPAEARNQLYARIIR